MEPPRIVEQPEITVVGIDARTNNRAETAGEGSIGELWARFWAEKLGERIPNRVGPDVVLAVYSDYESDEHGDYTVTIGCPVASGDSPPEGMVARTIPAARYAVITSRQGRMPDVVVETWERVWAASPQDLGGRRAYTADFELHDARAGHPANAQIDLYVALE